MNIYEHVPLLFTRRRSIAIQTTDDYVTISEAAEILHVGTSTLRRWIREERIPSYRLGQRRVYLKRTELQSLITPIQRRSITIETDIERVRNRRMTREQQERALAAIERIQQRAHALHASRKGESLIPALQLLDEARADRERELAERGL